VAPGKKPVRARTAQDGLCRTRPSFIKLAQILSSRSRPDTKRYADEFKKPQDRVPPFPAEDAIRIIEQETGGRLNDIFIDFDRHPSLAASIARCFRARLMTAAISSSKFSVPISRTDRDRHRHPHICSQPPRKNTSG